MPLAPREIKVPPLKLLRPYSERQLEEYAYRTGYNAAYYAGYKHMRWLTYVLCAASGVVGYTVGWIVGHT